MKSDELRKLIDEYEQFVDLWQRPEGQTELRVVRLILEVSLADALLMESLQKDSKKD